MSVENPFSQPTKKSQQEKSSPTPEEVGKAEEVSTAEGMMNRAERASSQTREQLLAKCKELGFDEKTVDEFIHSAKTYWDEGINFNVRGHEVKIWRGSEAKGISVEIQKVLEGDESNLHASGIGAEIDGEWVYGEQAAQIIKKYGPLVLLFPGLQHSSVLDKSGEKGLDDLLE